jgi:putative hydrolase of the HAD superfamily
MPDSQKTVLWDFDGTLALRPRMWSGTMIEILDMFCPGHGITVERIRAEMKDVYPWDTPETPHPHLSAPGAWWAYMERVIAGVYELAGIDGAAARGFAHRFHRHYVDPGGFILYEDAVETLEHFCSAGWRNVILSNHVPELKRIVDGLGIGGYFSVCLSSACTGFEKPSAEAFGLALSLCGNPKVIWMVGDNIEADVRGAQRMGLPAVLVHSVGESGATFHAETLRDVIPIIEAKC